MSANINKTLARVKQRIADKQFYEAQQAIKTVATRYDKLMQYDNAIEILYTGAQELLDAGESSSGSDLARTMLATYKTAGIAVDSVSKARVVQLFNKIRSDDSRRKDLIKDSLEWSGNDPELMHIFGSSYASEDLPYEAERLLLQGTKQSPVVLANLLFDWYMESPDVDMAAFFISRAVLGYLSVGNIRDASRSLAIFIERLQKSSRASTTAQTVTSSSGDEILAFDDHPLLNFFQLLIKVCQRKNTDLYNRLKFRYQQSIKDAGAFTEALNRIGELYFGIKIRNQANMFSDLMGSLLGPSPTISSRAISAQPPSDMD
ncbi:uncharacterized protein V1516DRAFT_667538 [Lipomyces oligophaga]|uniref:uncharacterized protein n=1 Tax=Lipomyces oligophaga TaxID=45792 RepID=UPI0034CDA818